MKKKIIIIGPDSNSWGGIATCIKNIEESEVLKKKYTFMHLVTWDNGKWFWQFIMTLRNVIKYVKYADLIHIHISKKGSTYRKLIISKLLRKKKYIVHMHNGEYGKFYKNSSPLIKKAIDTFLEGAEKVVFVSNYQKEETLGVMQHNNIDSCVVYNGIDTQKRDKKESYKLKVIYYGTVSQSRNIDEFIELAQKMINHDVEFLIAGNGDISKLNLNNIKYLGFIKQKEKEKILSECDIVFDHFAESFGIGLVEAMNYYICPLVYPIGAINEIISDNEEGIYFTNKIELESKLRYLCDNRAVLRKIQEQAYNKSFFFSKENYIRQIELIYEKVLT